MIFVILGTQRFPMNRVIDEIDSLIEKGFLKREEVIIQNGYSKDSKYSTCYQMIGEEKFDDLLSRSNLIITHGGTSSIIKALRSNKKTIIVPRKAVFAEHVDDHQKEICEIFKNEGFAEVIEDIKELEDVIKRVQCNKYNELNLSNQLPNYILNNVLGIN
ncbi:glycosyltransferase [Neobacillus cucumis]|uniref:glycosyltransferase n=1 Tax=Neobacillus cucumis TaxID=1740721 RepID=UPI002E1D73B2|nr:glycosyltransferase [Neobacillus cucumis]MED4224254.1 glycosyltransferase [Neobacillus cucumis]